MVDLKITWNMHKYPEEVPQEGRHDILAINTEGEIVMCFYMKEDASHDHSVWHDILCWCYEDEAYAALKISIQQIHKEALDRKQRATRYHEINRQLYDLRGFTNTDAQNKKRLLHKEADDLEADMKAHGEI